MSGRKPNKLKAEKLQFYVPALVMRDIEVLISEGYGSNAGEVASYLVKREIDDLKRSGVIERKASLKDRL